MKIGHKINARRKELTVEPNIRIRCTMRSAIMASSYPYSAAYAKTFASLRSDAKTLASLVSAGLPDISFPDLVLEVLRFGKSRLAV